MTVINESIHYGLDEDGAGCHDLLGTRCDPYIHKIQADVDRYCKGTASWYQLS